LHFFWLQALRPVACTSATVASTSSDDLLSYHYYRPMPGSLEAIIHNQTEPKGRIVKGLRALSAVI
jgi:hypothetical protein